MSQEVKERVLHGNFEELQGRSERLQKKPTELRNPHDCSCRTVPVAARAAPPSGLNAGLQNAVRSCHRQYGQANASEAAYTRSAVARSGLFDLSTLRGAAGEACHAKRRLDEGFEVVNLQWCVQLIKEAVHEPQMDRARHLWIIYCYLTERAAV